MIAIYTPYNSNRLNYTLNYIFKQQYGVEFTIYNTLDDFECSKNYKINYSNVIIENTLQIIPYGLLFEKGIQEKIILVENINQMPIVFKTKNDNLGFDVFSAVFYCLSRYEEYSCKQKDEHGRFPHTASFQFKNNCLEQPLVELWLQYLKEKIGLNLEKKQEIKLIPTIDIDATFAYKGRSFARQMAGFGKAFIRLNFREIKYRFKVIIGKLTDPNDNFDYQLNTLKAYKIKAHYFIQVGKYGKFDKNISPNNKAFIKILKKIDEQGHTIGLHPSYDSAMNIKIVKQEKEILEKMIGKKIIKSRQHFLKMQMPITYQNLIEIGITQDFTMGFSKVFGFRAGTSKPFYWYNLVSEKETKLMLIPFCTMDVVHKQFLNQNIEQTIDFSEKLKQKLKSINGYFCFVFHNESLSEHRGWHGWKKVFEQWLK